MEWSEKWSEIQELLSGLGIAVIVLLIVAWVFEATRSKRSPGNRKGNADSGGTEPARPEIPSDIERPIKDGPCLATIFVTAGAGLPMNRVSNAQVVSGRGIEGDRYFLETGHWSHTDECQVTLIAQEDLDEITKTSGVQVQEGQHRRNLVTRGIALQSLIGKRFRIGTAYFGYDRPRPPCAYIRMVSEHGMVKALGRRAGICVRCFRSGTIREGDPIVVIEESPGKNVMRRISGIVRQHQKTEHQ